jgi:hypothetical protein
MFYMFTAILSSHHLTIPPSHNLTISPFIIPFKKNLPNFLILAFTH